MSVRAGALALASALVLTACGGGGGSSDTTATRAATRTLTQPATLPRTVETTTAPATSTTNPATTTTQATTAAKPHTSSTSTSPESQPGGAGDETGIRVPATFTVRNGRLSPPSIGLPAFLRISLGVRNLDAKAHRVVFRGHTLAVPAHGSASVLVTGLKKGSYPVTLDGRRRALIVTGVQAGP